MSGGQRLWAAAKKSWKGGERRWEGGDDRRLKFMRNCSILQVQVGLTDKRGKKESRLVILFFVERCLFKIPFLFLSFFPSPLQPHHTKIPSIHITEEGLSILHLTYTPLLLLLRRRPPFFLPSLLSHSWDSGRVRYLNKNLLRLHRPFLVPFPLLTVSHPFFFLSFFAFTPREIFKRLHGITRPSLYIFLASLLDFSY